MELEIVASVERSSWGFGGYSRLAMTLVMFVHIILTPLPFPSHPRPRPPGTAQISASVSSRRSIAEYPGYQGWCEVAWTESCRSRGLKLSQRCRRLSPRPRPKRWRRRRVLRTSGHRSARFCRRSGSCVLPLFASGEEARVGRGGGKEYDALLVCRENTKIIQAEV